MSGFVKPVSGSDHSLRLAPSSSGARDTVIWNAYTMDETERE